MKDVRPMSGGYAIEGDGYAIESDGIADRLPKA